MGSNIKICCLFGKLFDSGYWRLKLKWNDYNNVLFELKGNLSDEVICNRCYGDVISTADLRKQASALSKNIIASNQKQEHLKHVQRS